MSGLVSTEESKKAETEFQEKMKERMRQAFGDLMPDAVLAGIVAKGIEEAFFKPRIVITGYNGREEKLPSWLAEFMEKTAKEKVTEVANKWASENVDKLRDAADMALAKGLASSMVAAFDKLFATAFDQTRIDIQSIMEKLRGM